MKNLKITAIIFFTLLSTKPAFTLDYAELSYNEKLSIKLFDAGYDRFIEKKVALEDAQLALHNWSKKHDKQMMIEGGLLATGVVVSILLRKNPKANAHKRWFSRPVNSLKKSAKFLSKPSLIVAGIGTAEGLSFGEYKALRVITKERAAYLEELAIEAEQRFEVAGIENLRTAFDDKKIVDIISELFKSDSNEFKNHMNTMLETAGVSQLSKIYDSESLNELILHVTDSGSEARSTYLKELKSAYAASE